MKSDGASLERLLAHLRSIGPLAVAFSGGVDSTLLLAAARDALGPEQVLALTACSPTQPSGQTEQAGELAGQLGCRQLVVATDELDLPVFRDNPPDRCYHCKKALLGKLASCAEQAGFMVLAEGTNADDAAFDHRPGLRAVRELGFRSPLLEVGLSRSEIVRLSRQLGLPGWDRPPVACLASRIPYGEPVTKQRLARVDEAERALRALGARQVRVRDHAGELARVELAPAELERFLEPDKRQAMVELLHRAGYRYVTLDLQGYRTGSLNEGLGR